MKCYKCGDEFREIHGDYEITGDYIGKFIVHDIDYLKCGKCNAILLSPPAVKKIDAAENEILQLLLQVQPIKHFITATEAALILKTSRQALHKHKRIRRGFIFQTTFGGKRVYLRKSVELFKEKGDGRFPLTDLIPDPIKIPDYKAPVDDRPVKKAN
jgi:hypothetical protein